MFATYSLWSKVCILFSPHPDSYPTPSSHPHSQPTRPELGYNFKFDNPDSSTTGNLEAISRERERERDESEQNIETEE